ncbi:Diphthine methyltransferase [Astathelohania contejeani]|uniref:Diphthine methyltransferase n=1 Tax=Astathelohania contejeani TaxID=164912 RepID=A0ABQ7HZN0_9MICR|nr:Diphthine methyltransferase [Thelohania contejeani]
MIIKTEQEVDCISYDYKGNLVYGCYHHENNIREGIICFNIEKEIFIKTSGTFNIIHHNNLLYAANVSDITIYNNNNNIHSISTQQMNTSIDIAHGIISVSQSNGFLCIYDENLNKIHESNLSNDILWTTRMMDRVILVGGEDEHLYMIDSKSNTKIKEINRSGVVTSMLYEDYLLYVGSYDEHVNIYDIRNYKLLKRIKIGGGVWKITKLGDGFILACMYEGVKVYDKDWKMIKNYKTESIAYGLSVHGNQIAFSSFYDKIMHIEEWNHS